MSSPIADLSYRNYDGPLNPPASRWWTIARHGTMKAFRNRFYWILTVFASWYYLVLFAIIFFVEFLASSAMEEAGNTGGQVSATISSQLDFLNRVIWRLQYLHGFSFGQLIFMFIALLVGAASIANDNRSNALLVYLSKPCSRFDYVVGKFLGVWIPLFVAMTLPTLCFFLYGMLSYRAYGFAMYAFVFPQMLLVTATGAALHTAVVLAISSLVKQGRLAGIFYGTLYMVTNIFTQMMVILWLSSLREQAENAVITRPPFVQHLYYASVDGLIIGFMKAVLGTDGGNVFGSPVNSDILIPAPNGFAIFGIIATIIALSLWVVWKRVRAVEVVQ